jgi:hypothetical protein
MTVHINIQDTPKHLCMESLTVTHNKLRGNEPTFVCLENLVDAITINIQQRLLDDYLVAFAVDFNHDGMSTLIQSSRGALSAR